MATTENTNASPIDEASAAVQDAAAATKQARKARPTRADKPKKPGQPGPGLPLDEVASTQAGKPFIGNGVPNAKFTEGGQRSGFYPHPELMRVEDETGPEPVISDWSKTEAGRAAAGQKISNWLQAVGAVPVPAGQRRLVYDSPTDMAQLVDDCKVNFAASYTSPQTVPEGEPVFITSEGWSYAAARLGWVTELVKTKLLPGDVLGYSVAVRVVDLGGRQTLGRAVITKASGWAAVDEPGLAESNRYALVRLAHIRAVGTAYQELLGWVVAAAGYQPIHLDAAPTIVTTGTAPQTVELREVLEQLQKAGRLRVDTEPATPQAPPVAEPDPFPEAIMPEPPAPASQADLPPATATQASLPGMEWVAEPGPEVTPTGREGEVMDKNLGKTVASNLYATVATKQRIIVLLNSQYITRGEKTNVLLNINRISEELGQAKIAEFEGKITRRHSGQEAMPVDPKRA